MSKIMSLLLRPKRPNSGSSQQLGLVNLFSNPVDAMAQEGKLILAAGKIEIKPEVQDISGWLLSGAVL